MIKNSNRFSSITRIPTVT